MVSSANRLLTMLEMFRELQHERQINEPIASVSSRLEGRRWVFSSLLLIPTFDIERERQVFKEAIWI